MDIAQRLERELQETTTRLRNDVALALTDDGVFSAQEKRGIVDEVDSAQRSIEREMTLTARNRLRDRAHRLVDALERLREGRYGMCEECDGPIAPARLKALPEVTTCLPCQHRRETATVRGAVNRVPLFDDETTG
jgi:DnaK suppressor protein